MSTEEEDWVGGWKRESGVVETVASDRAFPVFSGGGARTVAGTRQTKIHMAIPVVVWFIPSLKCMERYKR
jgi:hypothetical protein